MSSSESIMLLNMFSGDFSEDHIAHEVINLFHTDEDRSFIYAPHNGKPTENCMRVGKILMLRYLGGGRYEVLGRAFVKQCLAASAEDQREALDSMIYGDRPFESIMRTSGREFREDEWITFEASSSERPRSAIFLNCERCDPSDESLGQTYDDFRFWGSGEDEKNVWLLTGARRDGSLDLLVQHQRRFIEPNDALYETLNKLFDDESGVFEWEPFTMVKEFDSAPVESDARFLSLLNKEESELAYSNLLAHFLDENPDIARAFIELLLKSAFLEPEPQDLIPFEILREKHHIDIFINTHDKVFIIENKIHAELSKMDDVESGKTQLDKYVEKIAELFPGKKRLTYILCPPYHKLRKGQEIKQVLVEGKAVPRITYMQIYELLAAFGSVRGGVQENRYFQDFLAMLKWQMLDHQKDVSRRYLDLSMKRFQRAIEIDAALNQM